MPKGLHRVPLGQISFLLLPLMALSAVRAGAQELLIVDAAANQVVRVDRVSGRIAGVLVPPNSGELSVPRGAAFGPDGHLYVASAGNDRVLRYHGRTGRFLGVFVQGAQIPRATDMAFGP